MKLVAPLLAVLLIPAFSWSRLGALQEQEEHETELASRMEKIEDALKQLRKDLKDPGATPAALAGLAGIQAETLACKLLVPASAAEQAEGERAAFVTAYRRTMVDFLLRQLELEAALLDQDAEGTKSAFERLRAMEDSAHERFAPEEGD
jgi:hypothetical protein